MAWVGCVWAIRLFTGRRAGQLPPTLGSVMSDGKYPRLGMSWNWQIDLKRRYGRMCQVMGCAAEAKAQQFIEVSGFRGDDIPVWICSEDAHSEGEIFEAGRRRNGRIT